MGTEAASVRAPPSDTVDSMRALISVIKKEEITISVDLGEKIPVRRLPFFLLEFGMFFNVLLQAMNLASLPEACFPPGEATNKLASLRAKAMKARVAAPFPFMDLAEFLPSWADDSNPEAEAGDESKMRGKLDMIRWIAAFHSFALAADAAEVRTFVQFGFVC